MNKSFVYKTLLIGLAAVGLSLLTFLSYSVFPPSSSVGAAAFQESAPPPTATLTPTPTPAPSLTIDKGVTLVNDLDGDGVIDLSDTIRYTISYSNTMEITATDVIIVDDYDQILIASITNISGEGKDDGDTITWDLGTVEARASGSVTYEAMLKDTFPPGSINIENMATIASDETGLVSVTNTILVKAPNLTVFKGLEFVKDLDGDGIIESGDTIRYTIAYENTGDIKATNVTIVDDYNENFIASITKISKDGLDDGDTITWDLETLEAGTSGSVTYEATLRSILPPGPSNVENTATISCNELEPVSIGATVRVEVVPTPTPLPTPMPLPAPVPQIRSVPLTGLQLASLMAILATGALLALGFLAYISRGSEGAGYVGAVIEGISLVLTVGAVVILTVLNVIGSDAAVAILAAIVGYTLGRATAGRRPS